MITEEKEFAAVKDIEKAFGISRTTAVRMIQRGKVRGEKVAGTYIVNASDLDDIRERLGRPRLFTFSSSPAA